MAASTQNGDLTSATNLNTEPRITGSEEIGGWTFLEKEISGRVREKGNRETNSEESLNIVTPAIPLHHSDIDSMPEDLSYDSDGHIVSKISWLFNQNMQRLLTGEAITLECWEHLFRRCNRCNRYMRVEFVSSHIRDWHGVKCQPVGMEELTELMDYFDCV